MVKCEVTREFTLGKFDELKNIIRKNIDTYGKLYIGDIFECDEEMAKYLTGNNANEDVVVRIIEVVPEEKEKKGGETKVAEVKEEKKEVDTKQIAKSIINATKVIKTASKLKKTTNNDKK